MKSKKMGCSLMALVSAHRLLILAFLITLVTGFEEFKVGDSEGWRQPGTDESEMYTQWAATKTFHVRDSLRFEYTNDSVVVVDKWGYYHCNSSHSISIFNDGDTIVNLSKPGVVYLISGDSNHCKNGQRLLIEVVIHHQHRHSPPSIASPPHHHHPFMLTSPSPSPLSSSSATSSVSVPLATPLLLLLLLLLPIIIIPTATSIVV